MAEVEVLLEEADTTLELTAETNAAEMEVAMDESIVGAEWSNTTLEIGSDMTAEMFTKGVDKVLPDVMPESELSSSSTGMLKDVETLLGYPFEEDMEVVGDVSSDISSVKSETEAAQMERKSGWSLKAGLKMTGKVFLYGTGIILSLDWLANKLAAIVEVSMDADDPPAWAKNMTAEQKADLKSISAALPKLSVILQSWQASWKQYETNYVDLGTITTTISSTTQKVPVVYILFYTFSDMDGVLNNTKEIFSGGVDSLTTADVIVAMNNIFIVLADALSVFTLKSKSTHLQVQKFPPDSDKATINEIILTFKDGEKKVQAVGVSYLRFATKNSITTYMHVQLIQEIYRELQDVALPQMQAAAKEAFKDAAKSHMDDEKSAIQALAWVPGAGIELAKERIAKEQKIAAEKGTAAAQKAAQDKLTELTPQIQSQAQLIIKKHGDQDQAQLKKIANLAVEDATNQITSTVEANKSKK